MLPTHSFILVNVKVAPNIKINEFNPNHHYLPLSSGHGISKPWIFSGL